MAKNEPSKPGDVKVSPENATPAEERTVHATTPTEIASDTPAPEMSTEEAAALSQEGEAALKEMGEAEIEPYTPLDIVGEHIPAPGDVVVQFDKINEIVSGKTATAKETEKTCSADKAQSDKTEPQTEDTRQEWEKPLAEIEQKNKPKSRQSKATEKMDKKPTHPAKQKKASKAVKPEKSDKQKQPTKIGGDASTPPQATEQAQQETPPPAPELPPEPKETPRSNEPEQIVYLKLSDLYAFKDLLYAEQMVDGRVLQVFSKCRPASGFRTGSKPDGIKRRAFPEDLPGLRRGLYSRHKSGVLFGGLQVEGNRRKSRDMTQQRAQRAYFGPTWPEVAGFGEAPQQAALRDCGHSHIACRLLKRLSIANTYRS